MTYATWFKNVVCLCLTGIVPALAWGANNNWQKGSYTSLSGCWNEAGHWSGGVPVAAPPSGTGAYLQRVLFPADSYTVTFPEGETVSTANMTLNTVNGNTKVFSGLGSRLLLAATDADNYQKDDTAQAFRFNFAVSSGNNQGANVTIGDYRAPFALFTNFQATVSLVDKHGRILLDGGLYDFMTPTGGTSRTDTKLALGYEGLGGSFSSDADMTTSLTNGAVLCAPYIDVCSGFSVNGLTLYASTGVVDRTFTMGGSKNSSNPMRQCLTLDGGSLLTMGGGLSVATDVAFTTPDSSSRATAKFQTREILVTGGSTFHSDAKVLVHSGRTTFRIEDGSLFSSVGAVHIPADSIATGAVVIVDSEMRLASELYLGYSSGVNEMIGSLFATNATISAKSIYGRLRGEMTFAGTTKAAIDDDIAVGYLDSGSCSLSVSDAAQVAASGTLYVASRGSATASVSGGSVSADSAIVAENKSSVGTLNISGGVVTGATSVCCGFYSGASGSLVMTGGALVTPKLYTYNGTGSFRLDGGDVYTKDVSVTFGSATFSADGGTVHVTADGGNVLTGFSSATLGARGLTIDTPYGLTLAQDFTSQEGVTGLLAYAGASTLTVPAARTIDAAVWMKGGTTLDYVGSKLGGLIVGETDSAATVNVTLGTPIAVTGDVDIRNVRLVLTGACETGVTYPLITCTGDVSAGTAAAWASAACVASLASQQYVTFEIAEGASGGRVLQMTVKEMKVIPLVVDETGTIATNITLDVHDQLDITVADGATLTLSGTVTGDSIVKRGSGTLVLSGVQALVSGAYLVDGTMTLATAGALGDGSLFLRGGTLAFSAPMTFAGDVVVTPENDALAVVYKADADVAMALPSMTGGALLKRGAGKLTFNVGADTSDFCPAANVGGARSTAAVSFPASGVVPVAAYRGVHVVEGELVLKAAVAGAAVVNANDIAVGLNTPDGTVAPTLTLDGVGYTAAKRTFENACYMTAADPFARTTHVVLTNGASLAVGEYVNLGSTPVEISCTLDADASTVTVSDTYWPNKSDKRNGAVTIFRNGSALYAGILKIQGSASSHTFDRSVLAKSADGALTSIYQQDDKTTTFTFRNGATLALKTVDGNADRTVRENWYGFTFEGATWNMGADDVTFTTPKTHFRILTSGAGVTFAPPEGVTWTIAKDILGDGAIVVNGAGKVDFNGATFEGRTFGGMGTVANCTIGAVTVAIDLADDWTSDGALTFDGCFPTGKIFFDLGRTAENPMSKDFAPFVAAKYTGTDPAVGTWRLTNVGIRPIGATYDVSGGAVTATPMRRGFAIIFK